MHFFTVTALLASLATPTVYAAATTKSFVACSTGYGPKSTSSLKTVSKILTLPLTATRITVVIPKATVTPKTTVTSTSTATSTSSTTLTLPQSTSVFTETLTNSFFETKSETVTVFTTSTTLTTTTDTGGTTTVAASAGFVSIESSIPNSQKKRRAIAGKPVDARAEMGLVDRAAPKKYHLKFLPGGGVTVSPAFYPTAVGCGGFVAVITTKLITKTAAKTKTLTAPQPTSYVTSTSTEVTTATITPIVASTTVTEIASTTQTTTTTFSTTSTVSETVTVTESAPQATFYAGCADDNIIFRVNNNYINNADFSSTYVSFDTNNAYDCCVACMKNPKCGGTVGRASTRQCYLQIQDVCAPANQAWGLFTSSLNNGGIFASNGNCGQDYIVS